MGANSWYLQGTTGQSIGRRVAKTKLVKIETGTVVIRVDGQPKIAAATDHRRLAG
jgi:hypothetical protein